MPRDRDSKIGLRLSTDTRFVDAAPATAAELEVSALTILAHPDPRRIGQIVTLPELRSAETVRLSRLEPLFAAPGANDPEPLAEPHLSRKPLILSADIAAGEVLIQRGDSPTPAIVNGEPLGKRLSLDGAAIADGAVVELGPHVALLIHLQPPLTVEVPRFGLVGDSGAMMRLRREIELAVGLETPVLLRGASGTGKELVARAVHDAGPRAGRPWVVVNMAAVPPALAAAELFGARKGAYTGADRSKEGFFAAADGGTLFLDEIGDTPPEVQPLLLRALESGEIQPVGSARTRRVDVRVIAATDADLTSAASAGRFRTPLLHRLAGWEIRLPALTERRGDIGRLLMHFLEHELGQLGDEDLTISTRRPWASAPLAARLARYDWPGNVRQLRNVARRLAITHHADPDAALDAAVEPLLTESSPQAESSPSENHESSSAEPAAAIPVRRRLRKPSEVSDDELLAALEAHDYKLQLAAEALGLSRINLYRLIDSRPDLRKATDLKQEEIETALSQRDGDVEAAAADLRVSSQGLKRRMSALGLKRH